MTRTKKKYVVITFHTTSEAIAVEMFCKNKEIPGRLIPVPRQISASCGLCWRMTPAEYHEFHQILLSSGNAYDRVEEAEFAV